MGTAPRSPNPGDNKHKKSSSTSPYTTTTTFINKPSNKSSNTTTANPKIPVRQPTPTTSGNQGDNDAHSAYQTPGPGFNHTVANIPGIGLVYDGGHSNPVHGFNPAAGPQPPVHHQTPGIAPPQVLPPGFAQSPFQSFPQFGPVSNSQNPVMAYTTGSMPNQGQHFQPPVPDTTYGPIPHTYHPRFDNKPAPGQYVMIEGQLYVVASGPPGPPGGAQVQYVPMQQQPQSGAGAPIVIQQGSQQPIFVQGQPGFPAAPMTAQPAAFPAMMAPLGTPVVIGGPPDVIAPGSAPDVMGIGKTATEIQMEQYHTALNTGALEGQDIAPADPDPSRMYYCRELDGAWTLRNRFCIDNMGDCRWYVKPGGIFYAVRLAD
ncbi:uncharacterized protein F4817DRAFT_316824 [Daldinia loculata]|uniref:uncharacterized protein n=1 Tax=Daldinia loculata TaxID=103429 RepID=UPI0020C28151|nr:uncharacterized protein F4817DRAFT_316824 [Daldinia loculata]KAI1646327.1 hypothetical protein F4817DRAFT_316824 [Daldinia loculata]